MSFFWYTFPQLSSPTTLALILECSFFGGATVITSFPFEHLKGLLFSSWALSQFWLSFYLPVFPLSHSSLGIGLCLTRPFQELSPFNLSLTWGKSILLKDPLRLSTSIKQIDDRFNTFPNYCPQKLFRKNNP